MLGPQIKIVVDVNSTNLQILCSYCCASELTGNRLKSCAPVYQFDWLAAGVVKLNDERSSKCSLSRVYQAENADLANRKRLQVLRIERRCFNTSCSCVVCERRRLNETLTRCCNI